jgi:DNA replication and repair protein RecF
VVALLAPAFAEASEQLGLPSARLEYEGDVPTVELLEAAVARDLDRGTTSVGPHLHDVRIVSVARDLRLYGSQGEQRVTVLALLLAEAKLLAERRGVPPLLLFDDVLSELDPTRRRALADRVAGHGQTLITSTTSAALPVEPAQLLEVSPGEVRAA